MNQIKICVIGAGNWGLNHIKTLLSLNVKVGCIDKNQLKLDFIELSFPKVDCFNTVKESLVANYDGYVIATPPSSHSRIAKLLIKEGKAVLVEKPLCLSVSECKDLKSELDKFSGKLIVGHLLLFHPAIIKIKRMISKGIIGNIQYIYSNRLNLGTIRREENVFWSFAPHDISLFQFFLSSFPLKVDSHGGDFLQKNIHDTTITYLHYPSGIQGHIYVSWLHPFKEHRLVVIGSKGSLHFEDSLDAKPLLLYENDFSKNDTKIMTNKIPKKIEYDATSPLKNELKYFIRVINGEDITIANIDEGIDVIKILEKSTLSLKLNS
tara:strand:- start:821 stop:1786 length:966 start_codon:yes stop_codon:yes gene_type:complete